MRGAMATVAVFGLLAACAPQQPRSIDSYLAQYARSQPTAPMPQPTHTVTVQPPRGRQSWEASAIPAAEAAVRDVMRDPDSTNFRNARVLAGDTPEQRLVCGEYNAKNAYGGYVGFQPYLVAVERGAGPHEIRISAPVLIPAQFGGPERRLIQERCGGGA